MLVGLVLHAFMWDQTPHFNGLFQNPRDRHIHYKLVGMVAAKDANPSSSTATICINASKIQPLALLMPSALLVPHMGSARPEYTLLKNVCG